MGIPTLPDFTRVSYANPAVREWYAPQFERFTAAWLMIERLAVADGLRNAAWQFVTAQELVETTEWSHQHGLLTIPLELTRMAQGYSSSGGSSTGPVAYRCAFVRPETYDALRPFNEDEKIGKLLGYPSCCRKHFAKTWGQGLVDSTWEQLNNTDWNEPTWASTLWRWLGVRFVPHLPCSYSCERSNRLALKYESLLTKYGYREESLFAKELLAMPVSFSRVFGIAELISPITKVVTRSTWTREMQTYKKLGTHTPVTEALWTDNGFKSADGMRQAHTPLLSALTEHVPVNARVLDLGCGNAWLLRRLRLHRSDVALSGVDTKEDAIRSIPALTGKWSHDSIESCVWKDWNADVALLNPVRLLEMSADDAERTRQALSTIPLLVLYCYGDAPESLEAMTSRAGVGHVEMLTHTPHVSVGIHRRG